MKSHFSEQKTSLHSPPSHDTIRQTTIGSDTMALTPDDLLAISNLLDIKLDAKFTAELAPIKAEIKDIRKELTYIRVNLIENDIIPRLNTIEACYVEASKTFLKAASQINVMQQDIDMLKIVVTEHSKEIKDLQQLIS